MHPNQNYYKLFNVKREVRVEQEPREFSDTLSVGATIALQTIAEKIGVTKCVKEAFKSDKNCDSDFVSKMIVDLACYSILTGSTAY